MVLQTWLLVAMKCERRRDGGYIEQFRGFCTDFGSSWRIWITMRLTGLGVFQDPVQQLLLRQVAELSNDGPLGPEVGHALNRHESQEHKNCRPVFKFVPNPSK